MQNNASFLDITYLYLNGLSLSKFLFPVPTNKCFIDFIKRFFISLATREEDSEPRVDCKTNKGKTYNTDKN